MTKEFVSGEVNSVKVLGVLAKIVDMIWKEKLSMDEVIILVETLNGGLRETLRDIGVEYEILQGGTDLENKEELKLSETEQLLYNLLKEKKEISIEEVKNMENGQKLLGALGKLNGKVVEIIRKPVNEQGKLVKFLKLKE